MSIKVSLCMIVKNEETVLDRCLASIAHIVDEVIIVDTGSTDKTKEIAGKYTSKIYDFEWINDFSAARNYAAEQATGDWILVLDADEYIDEESYKEFIEGLIEDNGIYDKYGVQILNFTGLYGENLIQNFHDRIYKNNGKISYYRAIHEQLHSIDSSPVNSSIARLLIYHSGYLNKTVAEKGKSERNKELIDKEMKETKNAFDYFNLGNEYFSLAEYDEALKAYSTAYSLKSAYNLSWVSSTVIQIIACLLQLKKYNDALNVINDSIELYPGSYEMVALKGEVCFLRGQFDDAKFHFNQIIEHPTEYNHTILRPDLKELLPNRRLGEIYFYEKNYEKAIYHYVSVLNINKLDSDSIVKAIYILTKFHDEEEIIHFIKTNDLINKNNIHYYMNACFNVAKPNIIKAFIQEDEKTLQEIASLKDFCVSGNGTVADFEDLLKVSVIEKLNQKKLINIIDLYLLRERFKGNNKVDNLIQELEKNEQFHEVIQLLDDQIDNSTINDEIFLGTLQILLTYKNYNLAATLLKNVDLLGQKSLSKAAATLYGNDFKGEALQLYNKSDWDYYTEQDYLNIISGLLETGNTVNALEFTKYAMLLFESDFRFYKIILEHGDKQLLDSTVTKATEIFKGSDYLKKYR
ncbi:glycosyltransferase [Niallia taxi]|uniref:glycosyltransferase n=1 Tax=Niallia taxi TaxID=2499688 RepID=UPI003D2E8095